MQNVAMVKANILLLDVAKIHQICMQVFLGDIHPVLLAAACFACWSIFCILLNYLASYTHKIWRLTTLILLPPCLPPTEEGFRVTYPLVLENSAWLKWDTNHLSSRL